MKLNRFLKIFDYKNYLNWEVDMNRNEVVYDILKPNDKNIVKIKAKIIKSSEGTGTLDSDARYDTLLKGAFVIINDYIYAKSIDIDKIKLFKKISKYFDPNLARTTLCNRNLIYVKRGNIYDKYLIIKSRNDIELVEKDIPVEDVNEKSLIPFDIEKINYKLVEFSFEHQQNANQYATTNMLLRSMKNAKLTERIDFTFIDSSGNETKITYKSPSNVKDIFFLVDSIDILFQIPGEFFLGSEVYEWAINNFSGAMVSNFPPFFVGIRVEQESRSISYKSIIIPFEYYSKICEKVEPPWVSRHLSLYMPHSAVDSVIVSPENNKAKIIINDVCVGEGKLAISEAIRNNNNNNKDITSEIINIIVNSQVNSTFDSMYHSQTWIDYLSASFGNVYKDTVGDNTNVARDFSLWTAQLEHIQGE
ncbi:MAG: hypothetical protein ABIM30_00255 [candidate division WOR-3 bacterium]